MGMKAGRTTIWISFGFMIGTGCALVADQPATVIEAVESVDHGKRESVVAIPAPVGTSIPDGEYVKTGKLSRAAMELPSTSITRMGANTVFNYFVESNRVDLQAGTILFCKPKDARQLTIKTAAVMAGITGTTGFVKVEGEGSGKTYTFGIVEGHATARADGRDFAVGAGEILEFRPPLRPFVFAFDLPRFVKSSPLLTKFKKALPNQAYIDRAVVDYQDEVSRGFIQAPSHAINYSGEVPALSSAAYDSAMNSQGQSRGGAAPPPASTSSPLSAPPATSSAPPNANGGPNGLPGR
jgi:hypothetical protein